MSGRMSIGMTLDAQEQKAHKKRLMFIQANAFFSIFFSVYKISSKDDTFRRFEHPILIVEKSSESTRKVIAVLYSYKPVPHIKTYRK
jgi:hypothetical protein